ncbi:hypothetical protein FH972_010558 [Carpinus fangiana]|uniref:Uncharacterized protein n=1 Tax=Carpinus fangiana TaxID=176857 RepID=A0A660KQQ0_9ROSI|nr:hypothetical protein FH972_010558 [Carpinus fangiana]
MATFSIDKEVRARVPGETRLLGVIESRGILCFGGKCRGVEGQSQPWLPCVRIHTNIRKPKMSQISSMSVTPSLSDQFTISQITSLIISIKSQMLLGAQIFV